jgi:hypothetical protein
MVIGTLEKANKIVEEKNRLASTLCDLKTLRDIDKMVFSCNNIYVPVSKKEFDPLLFAGIKDRIIADIGQRIKQLEYNLAML